MEPEYKCNRVQRTIISTCVPCNLRIQYVMCMVVNIKVLQKACSSGTEAGSDMAYVSSSLRLGDMPCLKCQVCRDMTWYQATRMDKKHKPCLKPWHGSWSHLKKPWKCQYLCKETDLLCGWVIQRCWQGLMHMQWRGAHRQGRFQCYCPGIWWRAQTQCHTPTCRSLHALRSQVDDG